MASDAWNRLFAFRIHGRGHAAKNLPCAIGPNPRVRDPHRIDLCFGSVFVGPRSFDSIMINRDVAGDLNRELFDGVRLQLNAFRRVGGDPVGDVVLPHRLRTNEGPPYEVLVPKRAVLCEVTGLDVFPIRFLKCPDFVFLIRRTRRERSRNKTQQQGNRFEHGVMIFTRAAEYQLSRRMTGA